MCVYQKYSLNFVANYILLPRWYLPTIQLTVVTVPTTRFNATKSQFSDCILRLV